MDISTHHQQGHAAVTLNGQFTFNDHPQWRDVLDLFTTPGVRQITLQITRLEFVDSAALGMLLLANDAAQKNQKKLVIQGAQGQVKKMFDMANFQTLFTLA